ncbi:hypothetical protein B5F07_08685 [Lachnoclostridium sp. An169]|uniref:zinc ribbon domain-containing protein n=1 Tax=Lachnoclostridium sp. An169 TaxID=1965569 RepID=UPI000B399CEF|nr:zinc ribbon domain-containing protein [Lachnoclostridium sp. An169]OUP84202.1 hypothetical protein B5F07_08685 [Lachnoclostridium sp. An169]
MKRGKAVLIGALLAVLITGHAKAQENASETVPKEFSGTRTTICRIAQSDLDNFVSGGRASLEMVLVQNQQEWFTCMTKSQGRNLYLVLTFSFESYDDYEEKVTYLLGQDPVTTYRSEDQPYMENFSPEELFNYLELAMEQKYMTEEDGLTEFMRVQADTVELNGTEYTGSRALNTGKAENISFENVHVITYLEENGDWTRKIECSTDEKNSDRIFSVMKERSNSCNASFENDTRTCSITFTAGTEEELVKKTMMVLETSVNIRHRKYYKDDSTVRMETEESIDAEALLTKEGGFSWQMELTEDYINLSGQLLTNEEESGSQNKEATTTVRENTVIYEGREGEVKFYYDEAVMCDCILIQTDLSDELSKLKRTITFCMDGRIADDYHEQIKEEISSRMQDGDSLRIYDDRGKRFYEVSFQSWFVKDIESFTEEMLGVEKVSFEVERKVFPVMESSIEESFSLPVGKANTYSGKIELLYILPDHAESSGIENTGSQVMYTCNDNGRYSEKIEFTCFHYKKLVLYIIAVFLLAVVTVAVLGVIRNKKRLWVAVKQERGSKKKREAKKEVAIRSVAGQSAEWQNRYCPRCGALHKKGGKFCGKCGYKF